MYTFTKARLKFSLFICSIVASTSLSLTGSLEIGKQLSSTMPILGKYDQKHYNRAQQTNQPIGIAIIAYNRPQYLKQLITSLEQNPEAQTIPFYFILDGGPKAKQQENSDLINKSSLKHKEIILRERNYGCAKNQLDALRFMFEWCKFSKVIVMEEDLIVTPSYIKLTLALHAWAQSNYSNIGVVQSYSYCKLNRKQKKRRLHLVQANSIPWSFVTYCLDKTVWNAMKSTLYTYEALFVDPIPHTDTFARERSKPELIYLDQIKSWAKKLIATQPRPRLQQARRKVFPDIYANTFKKLFLGPGVGGNQDNILGFALWLAGYMKIQTVVNRVKHIGEIGISFGPNMHNEWGQDTITLDYFEEDTKIKDFKRVQKKVNRITENQGIL